MTSKVTAISLSIGIVFLTLLIFVLSVSLNISEAAQLFVDRSSTYLVMNDTKSINELKNRNYLKIIDPQTKQTTLFYPDKKNNNLSDNIIRLKNANGYDTGWYSVVVHIKKETFSKYYLGL